MYYVWVLKSGVSTLHLAIAAQDLYSDQEIMEIINQCKKRDLQRTDMDGNTPLHIVARSNRELVANRLCEVGAPVDVQNKLGNSPLHWAAVHDARNVASVLIRHGADVNAQNRGGNTPLHRAAARGNTAFVDMLIDAGADDTIKNADGLTPSAILARAINDERKEPLEDEDMFLLNFGPRPWDMTVKDVEKIGFEHRRGKEESYFPPGVSGGDVYHCDKPNSLHTVALYEGKVVSLSVLYESVGEGVYDSMVRHITKIYGQPWKSDPGKTVWLASSGININIALQAPGGTVFIMYIHPRMQRVKAQA